MIGMPQLYLYWDSRAEMDRDEVEEALSVAVGAHGETIGAGSGLGTTNLDVELVDTRPDAR
jgi:hypothetical protein